MNNKPGNSDQRSGIGSREATADKDKLQAPTISLPKGGGAIRGIGEKFAANPVTGTGSMTVPIATSPGRSGFGPQLSLSYDSGSGNGPFGFGWSLSLPSITRKTDKGLPRYWDAEESDEFILSGAEDLVPVLVKKNGIWEREKVPQHIVDGKKYDIQRYRPRIEGLFARIERWTNQDDPKDTFWRSISKDNITTWYGKTENSRIVAPNDETRIFSWLICQSYDDKGNAIIYEYVPEDSAGIDESQAHECNRPPDTRKANRYLKRIKYGNLKPNRDANWQAVDPSQLNDKDWMFEVVFDYLLIEEDKDAYGQHYKQLAPDADGQLFIEEPSTKEMKTWDVRQDPFSSYRAGFEVRTYRLCHRALMFHHFPQELGITDCLVRSTEFTYSESPVASFITSVTQSGYVRQPDGNHQNRYLKKSLPPLEFGYSKVPTPEELKSLPVEKVDPRDLENIPQGLDGSSYQLMDFDGVGISDIVSEQGGALWRKTNLSPRPEVEDGIEVVKARFGALELVALLPSGGALRAGRQLLDLAGDGQPDLVEFSGPTPGFWENDPDEGWKSHRTFRSLPNINWNDPNLRFVDLDGDGRADILLTEDQALTWYPSLGEEGFGEARKVAKPWDEEKGPALVFADGTQSVYLSDISGDGLADLVRIRNNEVVYFPNLGFGNFGPKVTMDNPIGFSFDHPEEFDQKRIRLADTDGSGTTDILYLGVDGVHVYFNQSGNSLSEPVVMPQFPAVDNVSSLQAMDLLGNGTACLVFSSPLPDKIPLQYIRLMQEKPHLLTKVVNNLGAETIIHYAPSTKFYLKDKYDGKPWITRLPFPVHVVERVETYDFIGRNRFVTRYAYHHGFFSGEEREFRGFAMVEKYDTEEFAALTRSGDFPIGDNVDESSHVPPILTKTWFHTGAYLRGEDISRHLAYEYYGAPDEADPLFDTKWDEFEKTLLPDTVLPQVIVRRADGSFVPLTLEEEREACRALKGSMLRQEVYARDGTEKEKHPYVVTEQNFEIRFLQPRLENRHGVFFIHPREAITYNYERNPDDPRFRHALTLEVDPFGNVLKGSTIGYGRLQPDPSLPLQVDRDKQTKTLITYTENRVTNAIEDVAVFPDAYRAPLPCETRTYELTGYTPTGAAGRFQSTVFVQAAGDSLTHVFDSEIDYEASPTNGKQRRLIKQIRTLYRKDNLSAFLRLGEIEPMALPGESYRLALTPGLAKEIFVDSGKLSQAELNTALADEGRYVHSQGDGNWWIPSGRIFYSSGSNDDAATEWAEAKAHFYLPRRYRDPFHKLDGTWDTETFVDYDPYDLLVLETRDVLENQVTVGERRYVLPDGTVMPSKGGHNYRVLQPSLVMDPNRNRSEVVFDALGMVAGTIVMGKPEDNPAKGDRLDASFRADLTDAEISAFHDANDPHVPAVNLLRDATTRIVYDLHRFRKTRLAHPQDPDKWKPTCVATLVRETHLSDPLPPGGLRIQIGFSYSDGFEREIQKKIQAEPEKNNGIVGPPRWVGSGWTIFNNKGNPVRQYEPFFSQLPPAERHHFEFGVRVGVSPVLFYDPAERVIATLHPNHSYEKVVFDPWRQTTYDVNDTIKAPAGAGIPPFDPKNDPEVGKYFQRLLDTEYLPTWYDLRTDPAKAMQEWPDTDAQGRPLPDNAKRRAAELDAAKKASAHADTPTTAHFDAFGRRFLTQARNRVVCADHPLNGTEDEFATRVELDIEGNQRAVRDAHKKARDAQGNEVEDERGRIVIRYAYDMLGNRIHQLSAEAGARWMLNDVAGKPIRTWDSRGHNFVTAYDALRRPVEHSVRGTTADSDPRTLNRDILVHRIEYGEGHADAAALNLRTRIYRHSDSAGVVTNVGQNPNSNQTESYDFKGNLLRSKRQLVSDYTAMPDWLQNPRLDNETFTSSTRYDALNRPIQFIAPHSSLAWAKLNLIQPVFNEANLLERVDVWLGRAAEPADRLDPTADVPSPVGVSNIDYDAKGQRQRIDYKNGASTHYDYDPLTFRLVHLLTKRDAAEFPGDCQQPSPVGWPGCQVQNLHYSYDPAGSITCIRDDAQQTIYFSKQRVEPSNDYTYDALYRLIEATGREHLGQIGGAPIPHSHNDAGRVGVLSADTAGRFAPNDGNAMDRYCEKYVYDAVGNFKEMSHHRSCPAAPSWRRTYAYAETSLIEDGSGGTLLKTNNRLSSTTVGNNNPLVEPYLHDVHGNMVRMPHLGGGLPGANMHWTYNDQLRQTDLGGGGTAYYLYDAAGQRVRKVWAKSATLVEERIYLGGFEIFRRHAGAIGTNTATLERETLHVMDDKQRIALVETRTLDTAGDDPAPLQLIRYQFGNHLGSASLELDDQSQIISYEEYTPYGSTSYQAVRNQTETPKRYRYTGMERDDESGLGYHSARHYASWLGRWTSCDPAGMLDGVNLFMYSHDSPSSGRDPSGQVRVTDAMEGDVNLHRHQGLRGPALISEHVDPLSHQREYLRNPAHGESPIPEGRGSAFDKNSPTVVWRKEGAAAKTLEDNLILERVKSETKAGGVSQNTAEQLGPEASIRRMEATGAPVPPGTRVAAIGEIDAKHADPRVRAFARSPENNPITNVSEGEIAAAVETPVNNVEKMTSMSATKDPMAKTIFKGNYTQLPEAGSPTPPSASAVDTPSPAATRAPTPVNTVATDRPSPRGGKVGLIGLLVQVFMGATEHELQREATRQEILDTYEAQNRFMTQPGHAESISQGPPKVCEQVFLSSLPMYRCR
jgi:RHS repeat-associated protein